MEPYKAIIVPLDEPPVLPPGAGGEPPRPDNSLPLFPFHPIVVPPGGTWPGEPPPIGGGGTDPYPDNTLPGDLPGSGGGGEQPPRPDIDLPLFPFHPIVVPPGGNWPSQPPTGGAPRPEHPIYYPPGTEPPVEPPTTEPPYPDNTLPGELPGGGQPPIPPTGGGSGNRPSHPINLPPNDSGYWIFVYVYGLGWVWVAVPPQRSVKVAKK